MFDPLIMVFGSSLPSKKNKKKKNVVNVGSPSDYDFKIKGPFGLTNMYECTI